jgi:hypothetical protein
MKHWYLPIKQWYLCTKHWHLFVKTLATILPNTGTYQTKLHVTVQNTVTLLFESIYFVSITIITASSDANFLTNQKLNRCNFNSKNNVTCISPMWVGHFARHSVHVVYCPQSLFDNHLESHTTPLLTLTCVALCSRGSQLQRNNT